MGPVVLLGGLKTTGPARNAKARIVMAGKRLGGGFGRLSRIPRQKDLQHLARIARERAAMSACILRCDVRYQVFLPIETSSSIAQVGDRVTRYSASSNVRAADLTCFL